MTDNSDGTAADPATIERDVRRTQDAMGDTVDKLEDKLNPHGMAQSLVGEDGMDTAKEAFEVARRNPLPVALIALGTVWLCATSEAPMIRRMREGLMSRFGMTGHSGRFNLRPRSAEPAPLGPAAAPRRSLRPAPRSFPGLNERSTTSAFAPRRTAAGASASC
jgi:hypothetical protein